MDGFRITCQCGHCAPMDDFTVSPSGLQLPRKTYQCRACGYAWTIQQIAPAKLMPSGFIMPPKLACVRTQGTI